MGGTLTIWPRDDVDTDSDCPTDLWYKGLDEPHHQGALFEMPRLGDLTPQQRSRFGWSAMVIGLLVMAVAVILVHYANFPETEFVDGVEQPVVLDEFNWVPRGWVPKAIGYLLGFGASQLLLGGAALVFLLGKSVTWSRAAVAGFLAFTELVIIFGIVPSEWLNLSQTDLNWSTQRVALTIPPWLVLGNDVDISWAVFKDSISMGYNLAMLVLGGVIAYKWSDIMGKRPESEKKAEPVSPYGRPLVRSDS